MGVYEKRRDPTWRSSEGRLREQTPRAQREGKAHLTGYEPGWSEREAERPRETARLGGSYGDVAVGISRKKELTIAVSKRRSREGPAVTENEKRLKSNGSVKLNRDREDFRTNSADKKKSALTYRETHQKAPTFMLGQFRELLETRDQDMAREQLPFLDQKTDQARLRLLQERADTLRARDSAHPELAVIRQEKDSIRQQLTEKKVQERRLRLILEKARENSEKMAGEAERAGLWDAAFSGMEEPPPEEAKPDAQNNGKPAEDEEKHKNL